MTNEELVLAYYAGDRAALSELYSQNIGLLKGTARQQMRAAKVDLQTDYAAELLEDLVQVGSETMLRMLAERRYNPDLGKFVTYAYPYLRGAMLRHLAAFHHREAEPLLVEVDDEYGVECVQNPRIPVDERHPDDYVFRKIEMAHFEPLFWQLSEKERQILGSSFGVFGYRQMSVEEIATIEMVSEDAVQKRRKEVLSELKRLYEESDAKRFRAVILAMETAYKRAIVQGE